MFLAKLSSLLVPAVLVLALASTSFVVAFPVNRSIEQVALQVEAAPPAETDIAEAVPADSVNPQDIPTTED